MLSMPVEHPDIEEFINVKNDLDKVTFANISVMASDAFMRAVKEDKPWEMSFTAKDTGEVIKRRFLPESLCGKLLLATGKWRSLVSYFGIE